MGCQSRVVLRGDRGHAGGEDEEGAELLGKKCFMSWDRRRKEMRGGNA